MEPGRGQRCEEETEEEKEDGKWGKEEEKEDEAEESWLPPPILGVAPPKRCQWVLKIFVCLVFWGLPTGSPALLPELWDYRDAPPCPVTTGFYRRHILSINN